MEQNLEEPLKPIKIEAEGELVEAFKYISIDFK